MTEVVVVFALAVVLAMGLSGLIETPRELLQRQSTIDLSRLSVVDRAVRQLDDDVRFARGVAVPSPGELVVSRGDGGRVAYEWGGPGLPLMRISPEGTGVVLAAASRVRFTLGMTELRAGFDDGALESASIEIAGFDRFPRGTTGVLVRRQVVDDVHGVGFFFTAAGLGRDDALVHSAEVRLRKRGTQPLRVRLLEADPESRQPIVARALANQVVHQNSLPVGMSDFTIPLTSSRAVSDGDPLFLELSVVGDGSAAEVEFESASGPVSPGREVGGFLVSSGGLFRPMALALAASQAVFSLTATRSSVAGVADARAVTTVPTSVLLTLVLTSGPEPADLDLSFPVANNLALVNR